MPISLNVAHILQELQLDGWLISDFHGENPLARKILSIPSDRMLTRRYLYWCPAQGVAKKVVHKIEQEYFDHMEGDLLVYSTWQEFEAYLEEILSSSKRIAVEYSEKGRNPSVSFMNAGLAELVRGCGVELVSSGPLILERLARLSPAQVTSHFEACKAVQKALDAATELIKLRIENGMDLTERDVQKEVLSSFRNSNCITEHDPIVAIAKNAANPHYCIEGKGDKIRRDDLLLIDLWCKKGGPDGVYADITRMFSIGKSVAAEHKEVFEVLKEAQLAAINLLQERIERGKEVLGWEVDAAARKIVEDAGYGDYFIHRLGHSIAADLHGYGPDFDNYEAFDDRPIVPTTCYSIEPAIYIPQKFGMRIETNVLVEPMKLTVSGRLQSNIIPLF